MPFLLVLAQTLLPQLIQALEPLIATLIAAHTSGNQDAIGTAVQALSSGYQDLSNLNTLIGTCNTEKRDATPAELAPFASHLATAVAKLQSDIGA